MSTQINQYMVFGFMMDYKKARQSLVDKWGEEKMEELLDQYHDSAFDRKIVEINGCSLIMDGCAGKYLFFGKIFSKTNDGEYLSTQKVEKIKKHIKLTVAYESKAVFGEEFILEQDPPSRFLMTHYR
jgi:hypothetical protein